MKIIFYRSNIDASYIIVINPLFSLHKILLLTCLRHNDQIHLFLQQQGLENFKDYAI